MPPNLDVAKYVYDLLERVLNFGFDEMTGTLRTITEPHAEIHEGNHFLYTDSVELNAAASQDYLITTPNTTKWIHMVFVLDGSAITQFRLYEGADRTGTTLQTVGNSNRNSPTTAGLTIHKGQSGGSTDGVLIHQYKGGAATQQSRQGTGTRNDEELILKQNTKYLLRVTSGTNNDLTNVQLAWYEEESG